MLINPLFWDLPTDRQTIYKRLMAGHIVAGTSDTVLGLLAPFCKEGRDQLNLLKGRQDKPYIVLISSADQLSTFTNQDLSPEIRMLLAHAWPGPLTIIVNANSRLPTWAISGQKTIALRVPHHPGLQELLHKIPALFSTSANLAGQPTPSSYEDLDPTLLNVVGQPIIDRKASPPQVPSTLVDLTKNRPYIIRAGAYTSALLNQICSKK